MPSPNVGSREKIFEHFKVTVLLLSPCRKNAATTHCATTMNSDQMRMRQPVCSWPEVWWQPFSFPCAPTCASFSHKSAFCPGITTIFKSCLPSWCVLLFKEANLQCLLSFSFRFFWAFLSQPSNFCCMKMVERRSHLINRNGPSCFLLFFQGRVHSAIFLL